MEDGESRNVPPAEPVNEAASTLNVGARQRRLRRFWRMLPGAPRCKMCNGPFGGVGGAVSKVLGKGRWPKNPNYCNLCFKDLYRKRIGAEIECTLLFADIR